jgi:hypothetical protein
MFIHIPIVVRHSIISKIRFLFVFFVINEKKEKKGLKFFIINICVGVRRCIEISHNNEDPIEIWKKNKIQNSM